MDASKLKAGDRLHIAVEFLEHDTDGEINVYVAGLNRVRKMVGIDPASILSIEPRPIAVGAICSAKDSSYNWLVLAIDGDDAWCRRMDSFVRADIPLAHLTREEASDE